MTGGLAKIFWKYKITMWSPNLNLLPASNNGSVGHNWSLQKLHWLCPKNIYSCLLIPFILLGLQVVFKWKLLVYNSPEKIRGSLWTLILFTTLCSSHFEANLKCILYITVCSSGNSCSSSFSSVKIIAWWQVTIIWISSFESLLLALLSETVPQISSLFSAVETP